MEITDNNNSKPSSNIHNEMPVEPTKPFQIENELNNEAGMNSSSQQRSYENEK